MATADEFRAARHAAGLSVRKAAEYLGVSPSTIQRWEAAGAVDDTAVSKLRAYWDASPDGHPGMYHLGRLLAQVEAVDRSRMLRRHLDHLQGTPARTLSLALTAVARARPLETAAEASIEAIAALIPAELPAHFVPEMEGPMWLGYYHERAALRGEEG